MQTNDWQVSYSTSRSHGEPTAMQCFDALRSWPEVGQSEVISSYKLKFDERRHCPMAGHEL